MLHGHGIWTNNTEMQPGHAAWARSMDKQNDINLWTYSMKIRHGQAGQGA
jgi:hypothetical protein